MDVDVERRLVLSEDEEDEDDLMDLMPASLGQLMGPSPGGEECSRLDKLLLVHSLKAKPHCTVQKYTRRSKGPLATRRKPVTKLKLPVPSWGKENEKVLGRQQGEVRSKLPRPRLSVLHAESRRKTRVKLDIKVPNWDNEELIVEEEQVNASFVNSEETRTSYEASLPSISPAFRDEGLISDYNAARSMLLKTPEFTFQGSNLDPTPPPLEALKKMVDSPERLSCLEAECVSGLEAEMSTIHEPEREAEAERRFQPVQHLQLERQQQHLEAEVSAVHEPEPEAEVEHYFQPEQQPEVSAVHESAPETVVKHQFQLEQQPEAMFKRQFQPEQQPEVSVVHEPEPGVAHQFQSEQQPEVSADQGPEDGQRVDSEAEVDHEPQPGQQPEIQPDQHRQQQQQQPEAQPVLDAAASNTFSVTPENEGSPVSEQQPAKKRKPRAKRRNREAQASPTLEGGTKWVDGQRRSTRFKSRPLETWRGERLLYARVHSTMMTLVGVKHSSPLPPWPKRGQYKYNYKVDSLVSEEHEAKLKLAAYG